MLDIIHYDESGWKWHSEEIADPIWEQIEQSIRLLDKFQRPFVTLRLRDEIAETGYLEIVGGQDVYSMYAAVYSTSTDSEHTYLSYFDPTKSDKIVDVWTSDQGYYPEENYVCYDLHLILKVAHHYEQCGELSPAVLWR